MEQLPRGKQSDKSWFKMLATILLYERLSIRYP